MSGAAWIFNARCGSALLFVVLQWGAAWAEDHRWFDIDARPLSEGLALYSAMTGMAVLFDSSLIAGLDGAGVHGRFTDHQALTTLLVGTGLQARYSADNAFTLQRMRPAHRARAEAVKNGAATAPTIAAHRYASLVQHSLWQALCADAQAEPGAYRAAVQLRIDASGGVAESRLLASTGDSSRDTALREVLATLRLALAPPPTMAQPITLLLKPMGNGHTRACPGVDKGYVQANHQGALP